MRILFVNPYYKPYLGGIERVIEKLSREFLKDPDVKTVGVLTTFTAFPGKTMYGLPPKEIIDGVTVYRRSFWPKNIPFISASPGAGFFGGEMDQVVSDFKPDVVQLMSDRWWPVNFRVWNKVKPEVKVFYSLSFHDLNLAFPANLAKIPIRYFNHELTNGVDKTITITKLESEKVRQAYSTDPNKIAVIPWGVDQPDFFKRSNSGTVRILAVGRLSKHKGQDKLLQAYLAAKPKFEKQTELILVGSDEGLWQELESKIKKHNLEQEVKWLGEADETKLRQAYIDADIFALTPAYEAFGLVFIEAASYNLPLVTWDVGAVKEVLGDAAFISRTGEIESVTDNLVKLVNSADLRSSYGDKAAELSKSYSWDNTAKKFLTLYKS